MNSTKMVIPSCYLCYNLKAKKVNDEYTLRCSKKGINLKGNFESLEVANQIHRITFWKEAKECEYYEG